MRHFGATVRMRVALYVCTLVSPGTSMHMQACPPPPPLLTIHDGPKPFWRKAFVRPVVGMSVEVPHDDLLALVDWGQAHPQVLLHRASGEHVVLEGRWKLQTVDHKGRLIPLGGGDDRQAKWANDVLEWSLHELMDGSGDTTGARSFFFSKSRGESQMKLDLAGQVMSNIFKCSTNAGVFTSEIYIHTIAATDNGGRMFWTSPYVQDKVFGSQCHNRWVARNLKSFANTLRPDRGATRTHRGVGTLEPGGCFENARRATPVTSATHPVQSNACQTLGASHEQQRLCKRRQQPR